MRNSDPRDVLIAPVVSEKSYGLMDANKYTFVVPRSANKTEIDLLTNGRYRNRFTRPQQEQGNECPSPEYSNNEPKRPSQLRSNEGISSARIVRVIHVGTFLRPATSSRA